MIDYCNAALLIHTNIGLYIRFMVPEQMARTADPDLIHIASESDWRPSVSAENPEENLLTQTLRAIATQFRSLRDARIPVHLLLGRRDTDISSCYWGWPHDERGWELWKDKDFSANLEMISPHVDTLSIMYDLRNPLDPDRLSELEGSLKQSESRAMCPSRKCPWKESTDGCCPFEQHPLPHANSTVSPGPDELPWKIENRSKLKRHEGMPRGYGSLDNGSAGGFLSGGNPNDHPSDDSDTEEATEGQQSAQRIARRAAFTREALGWQRFWNKYALRFTSLTVLRVRMPRSFDKVGSWRLAKLLSPNVGWAMLTYTDEQQHMRSQTERTWTVDQRSADIYEHKSECRVYPAGRFVRRTWVWDSMIAGSDDGYKELAITRRQLMNSDKPPDFPIKYLQPEFNKRPYWADRLFDDLVWETTQDGEKKELSKAVNRAHHATSYEQAYDRNYGLRKEVSAPGKEFRLLFCGKYGSHIRNIAGDQWRSEIESLEIRLQPGSGRADSLLRNVASSPPSMVSQPPPYEVIFRVADDEDVHPVSGLQWTDNIALQPSTVDHIIEEARKGRNRPNGERPQETECVSFSLSSSDSNEHGTVPKTVSLSLFLDLEEETSGEGQNDYHGPALVALSQTKSTPTVWKPKRKLPFSDSSSEVDSDSNGEERSSRVDHAIVSYGSGLEGVAMSEGGRSAIEGLGVTSSHTLTPKPQLGTQPGLEIPTDGLQALQTKRWYTKPTRESSNAMWNRVDVPFDPKPIALSKETKTKRPICELKEIATTKIATSPPNLPYTANCDAKQDSRPTPPSEGTQKKPNRKRKTPTPALPWPTQGNETQAPAKRVMTAQRTTRKAPAYVEVPSEVGEAESEDDEEEGKPRKKRPTKRTDSTTAFQPSNQSIDESDDSEYQLPFTRRRGRTRASKRKTPDSPRRANAVSKTPGRDRAGADTEVSAGDETSSVDYNRLTVVSLKVLLREKGVKLTGMMRKAHFVAKLEDLDKTG
jgi:hypothetical protein